MSNYMKKHSVSVYFVLKKQRKDKQGLSPIVMYIGVNAERVLHYTGKKIKESDWDLEKQLVKGKTEEVNLINDFLYQLRNKIYTKETELMGRGFLITAQLLKDALNDNVEELREKTLMQVFDEYQEMRKGMVGKTIVKDTFYHNELTGRYLRAFTKEKLQRQDIFLHEVNLNFIHGFHSYLLSERNLVQNGTVKHLKFLKFLMQNSVANGYISCNAISTYKIERKATVVDFLDELELRKIINFDTPLKDFKGQRMRSYSVAIRGLHILTSRL